MLHASAAGSGRTNQPILRIKATLQGVRPPIWRRLEIPAGLSLFELHGALQAAMGWTNSHLHQFIHGETVYGAPDREFGMPTVSERRTQVGELLVRPGDRFIYEYDFGDGWEHLIMLELIAESRAGTRYPRVIAGKRACPPEDVGGAPGYEAFLAAIADPARAEHHSMLEWIGGKFDPEFFDLIAANDAVPKKRPPRRRDG